MKTLWLALATPWRCGHRSLRWLSGLVFALCALGALGIGLFDSKADWSTSSALVLCFGLAYAWAFFFPNTLLLAIDARTLRVPGMDRKITTSLIIYALLSVIPATLILGACGGNTLNIGALLGLSTVAGMSFSLLPRYIAMCMGFFPALSIGLRHVIDIPGPGSPSFAHWAVPVIVLFLLIDMLRWKQLLHRQNPLQEGLSSAMVMQFRRRGAMGGWMAHCSTDMSAMMGNRPDWMQPGADLRKVGPHWPVNTLRVALGGWYVPRTLVGHLRGMAPVLLPMLLMIPVLLLIRLGNDHVSEGMWIGMSVGILGWVGVFGPLMLMLSGTLSLRKHWTRTNTELPLMALLPGLGHSETTKNDMLHASLRLPLSGLAVLTLLILGVAWAAHIQMLGLVVMALAELVSGGAMIALILNTLGGNPMANWKLGVGLAIVFALLGISLFIPSLALGRTPWPLAQSIMPLLIAGWLVLGSYLAWLARSGWRALAKRPHVFLTNT